MAVTDIQFQTHSDQNNAEFSNRQILLRGTGVPNQPAPLGSFYLDEASGPPHDRYEKTGILDTNWTIFESGGSNEPITMASIRGDGTVADGLSKTNATTWVLTVAPTDIPSIRIFLNGMLQFNNNYNIVGSTITFTSGLENTSNEELIVVYGDTSVGGGGGSSSVPEILESTITDLESLDFTLSIGVQEKSIDVYWFALKITPTSCYTLVGTTLSLDPHPDFQLTDKITIKYRRTV